jgi:hypothetical protein
MFPRDEAGAAGIMRKNPPKVFTLIILKIRLWQR